MSGQYWQDCGLGVKKGLTMGQAMKSAGYHTFALGKWHLDGNPVDRGFDRYFGHLSGGSHYFNGNPSHRLDDKPFKPAGEGTFYTTDANADHAIKFITDAHRQHPDRPFFTYLAFNAPHAPCRRGRRTSRSIVVSLAWWFELSGFHHEFAAGSASVPKAAPMSQVSVVS